MYGVVNVMNSESGIPTVIFFCKKSWKGFADRNIILTFAVY